MDASPLHPAPVDGDPVADATSLATALLTSAAAVAALGTTAVELERLDESELRAALELVTTAQGDLDRYSIAIASGIAYHSRPELGYSGLSQRHGHRTPEAFIQSVTGSTRIVAATLVHVGTMVAEITAAERLAAVDPEAAAAAPCENLWQAPLVHAIQNGQLRPDAVNSIRRGLGDPGPGVSTDQLQSGCELLAAAASGDGGGIRPTVDELYRAATDYRDRVDVEAVIRREKTQHDNRYLKAHRGADGMVRGSFRMAPEDGDMLLQVLDQGTNPRRGGPRFISDTDRAWAQSVADDPRTIEQINVDTLVGALHIAANADHSQLPGQRPAVRVITVDTALAAGDGTRHSAANPDTSDSDSTSPNRTSPNNATSDGRPFTSPPAIGRLQDSHQPVSVPTLERLICDTGTITITVNRKAQILQLGREQRLFSSRQRIALAARWGGCAFPGCARPPGWCEAHHVRWYQRDGGTTDIENGILLCRHHHMLVHNNGWEIRLDDGNYWLIAPVSVDPHRTPRLLTSKNDLIEDIRNS